MDEKLLYALAGCAAGCALITLLWIISGIFGDAGRKRTEKQRTKLREALGELCATVSNAFAAYTMGTTTPATFRRAVSAPLQELTALLHKNMQTLDPFYVKYMEGFIEKHLGAAQAVQPPAPPTQQRFEAAPLPSAHPYAPVSAAPVVPAALPVAPVQPQAPNLQSFAQDLESVTGTDQPGSTKQIPIVPPPAPVQRIIERPAMPMAPDMPTTGFDEMAVEHTQIYTREDLNRMQRGEIEEPAIRETQESDRVAVPESEFSTPDAFVENAPTVATPLSAFSPFLEQSAAPGDEPSSRETATGDQMESDSSDIFSQTVQFVDQTPPASFAGAEVKTEQTFLMPESAMPIEEPAAQPQEPPAPAAQAPESGAIEEGQTMEFDAQALRAMTDEGKSDQEDNLITGDDVMKKIDDFFNFKL